MANYPLPEQTPASAPPRGRATGRGLPAIRTIAPRWTRTRPWLSSFLHNIGPGSSWTLPGTGLLSWCFIVTLVKPYEGPPTFQLENGGLPESIQGAAERKFRRGVEERELRERVNSIPPYHLHNDFKGFCHPVTTIGMEQQLEWNPIKTQKSDHFLPELYIQFLSSTHQFTTSFSTSVIPYLETFSLFFPGRPSCSKAQQNGKKNERKKRS